MERARASPELWGCQQERRRPGGRGDRLDGMDSPIVVAGGGAAGRAAVQTLLTHTDLPIIHLAGPAREAIDRTLVDKAIMTGRVSPDRAVAMRPPLEGADTRFDTLASVNPLASVAEVPVGSGAHVGRVPRWSLTLGSGGVLEASALLVATGTTPRRLAVPGAADWARTGRISTLHSVDDALRIRRLLEGVDGARVLVSGTGLVGAEAASLLTEAGHRITLVARSAVPGAAGLGPRIAGRLAEIHRSAVDARWGTGVVALREGAAVLSDGSEVEADLVIVAHGAEPRVPAGVTREDMPDPGLDNSTRAAVQGRGSAAGVPVDSRLRAVGRAGILAAGAIARFGPHADVPHTDGPHADGSHPLGAAPQAYRVDHWDDAEAQGAHAARTLLHDLGRGEDPGPYRPWSPWSARIHGHQLAGYGHPLPGAAERIVSEDPLLVEFVAGDDGGAGVSAVVGLAAGRALRDHARSVAPRPVAR